jgi:hypothetical protein
VGGAMLFQPVLPFPLYGGADDQWMLITRPTIPIVFSTPIPKAFNDFDNQGGHPGQEACVRSRGRGHGCSVPAGVVMSSSIRRRCRGADAAGPMCAEPGAPRRPGLRMPAGRNPATASPASLHQQPSARRGARRGATPRLARRRARERGARARAPRRVP